MLVFSLPIIFAVIAMFCFGVEGLKWMALAAGFAFVGMISFVQALKIGQASIVVPVRNLALGVTVILAIVFLGEELTLIKVIGITLAVISLVMLSM